AISVPLEPLDVPRVAFLEGGDALQRAVAPHGATLAMLADGSAVATLHATGSATDLAARAARCALALRGVLPLSQIGLATGRGRFADRVPVGEVIDPATRAARSPRDAPRSQPPP